MTAPFWILATLLKGTVLLLGAIVIAALLRRASAALRHIVWGLGIVTVLVLPLVSFALPWQLRRRPPGNDRGAAHRAPRAGHVGCSSPGITIVAQARRGRW